MTEWKIHVAFHFLIAFLVCFLGIVNSENLNVILAGIIGSFFPDIDHFSYYKKRKFKSFLEFLIYNIKSERKRRGLLIFHNIFVYFPLMIILPLIYLYSSFLGYFFLGFILHITLDFVDDKFLIKTIKHWKILRVKE